jgi:hypothetical protein
MAARGFLEYPFGAGSPLRAPPRIRPSGTLFVLTITGGAAALADKKQTCQSFQMVERVHREKKNLSAGISANLMGAAL